MDHPCNHFSCHLVFYRLARNTPDPGHLSVPVKERPVPQKPEKAKKENDPCTISLSP